MYIISEVEGPIISRLVLRQALEQTIQSALVEGLRCDPDEVAELLVIIGGRGSDSPRSIIDEVSRLGSTLGRRGLTTYVLEELIRRQSEEFQRRRTIARSGELPPWLGRCHSPLWRLPALAHERGGKFVAISQYPRAIVNLALTIAGFSGKASSDGLLTMEDQLMVHDCRSDGGYLHPYEEMVGWTASKLQLPKESGVIFLSSDPTSMKFATESLENEGFVARPMLVEDGPSILVADKLIQRLLTPKVVEAA